MSADRQHIRSELLQALTEIAPEVEPQSIDAGQPLRRQVDLDSADWLNFLVAVHLRLGVDIPDAEAARLTTLDKLIDYCAERARHG
ncbi:MAG TPA: acyl carrier protein [Burkholderiaceae bacterium]|nr:acyl carrier protein [Burkholderiaceae bacterium]